MQFYFLIAGFILSIGDMPKDVSGEQSVYRVESTHVPASNNAYYFLENRKLLAGDQGHLHQYTQSVQGNVVGISFNNLSVPFDISAVREWKYKSNSCRARSWPRTRKTRFLVICNESAQIPDERLVYMYELGKGITGFFKSCLFDKDCWYQLQSTRGLLATLPPVASTKQD